MSVTKKILVQHIRYSVYEKHSYEPVAADKKEAIWCKGKPTVLSVDTRPSRQRVNNHFIPKKKKNNRYISEMHIFMYVHSHL